MKTRRFDLVFSIVVFSALVLGACGPADNVSFLTGGDCPPGYIPVYDEQIGSPGTCQPNPNPPLTVWPDENYDCPPGYHMEMPGELISQDYCELDPTPTPSPVPQAIDSGPPIVKPVMLTVTVPANGICPPGYHKVNPGGLEFPNLDYCELDPTPTPPLQASNAALSDPKPAIEVVQYCVNKGADLGGANITFPADSSLHVEDWFSESPGHVKCVDDVSNPRTCWGPESDTFEVLVCNTDFVKNDDYTCETLLVTLGSCAPERDNPDPAPTACSGHC